MDIFYMRVQVSSRVCAGAWVRACHLTQTPGYGDNAVMDFYHLATVRHLQLLFRSAHSHTTYVHTLVD